MIGTMPDGQSSYYRRPILIKVFFLVVSEDAVFMLIAVRLAPRIFLPINELVQNLFSFAQVFH